MIKTLIRKHNKDLTMKHAICSGWQRRTRMTNLTKQWSRRFSTQLHLFWLKKLRTFWTNSWKSLNLSRKSSQLNSRRHRTKSSRRRESRTEKKTIELKQNDWKSWHRRDRRTRTTDRSRRWVNPWWRGFMHHPWRRTKSKRRNWRSRRKTPLITLACLFDH